MYRNKNKTAQPISVSDCTEAFSESCHYLGESVIILTLDGDCVSKVYKDNNIESLNPPFARGGLIYSVKYEAEKDVSIVEYRFRGGFRSRSKNSERFRKKMQAKINAQKIKEFKAQLLNQENENGK